VAGINVLLEISTVATCVVHSVRIFLAYNTVQTAKSTPIPASVTTSSVIFLLPVLLRVFQCGIQ